MSRKSLILCLSALLFMLLAIGVAIAFLYSGTGSGVAGRAVAVKAEASCLTAVPSDAVSVLFSSRADKACQGILSSFELPDSLRSGMERGSIASLKRCPMSVSLHYSGRLMPLYVFDTDRASEGVADELSEKLRDMGCCVSRHGDFVVASESEALVKSSVRHIDMKVSVVDSPGFAEALGAVDGDVVLLASHLHARKLMNVAGTKELTRHSSFLERVADWSVYDISKGEDKSIIFDGAFIHGGDADQFMTVLENCTPSESHIGEILPSYATYAVSFPFADPQEYVSSYKNFVDSRQELHEILAWQKRLKASAGVMPETFFEQVGLLEIANASFMAGGKKEYVNLMRVSNADVSLIFKGTGVTGLKDYQPQVHPWAYPSFAASVFGSLFALKDESSFTYRNGWIITGSRNAVEEYVKRNALRYNLNQYLADAGKESVLADRQSVMVAYLSLSEDRTYISSCLKPVIRRMLSDVWDAECCPLFFFLGNDHGRMTVDAGVYGLTLMKTKAPEYERDTTVVVPSGPFKVRNSHTCKTNTFYQNAHKSICLRDENGKDLWGVPFDQTICGTAHNVDYYANGKLQIIFGAGSSIYIIDRLGRYVNGFPIDLGKKIILGPDVYDFSGAKRYNIMVLHDDNTIDMYNLKGRKPEMWKGITADETIKSLPERLTLGGRDFWVVRTSIQTLIYPFYGGTALTVYDGDGKIRPDSRIKVVDSTSVEVSCYDGRTKVIKLI